MIKLKVNSNKIGLYFSLLILFSFSLVAVFAYQIIPDKSINANQMHLSIPYKKSGFAVDMLMIPIVLDSIAQSSTSFNEQSLSYEEIPIYADYRIIKDSIYFNIYPSKEKKKVAKLHSSIEKRKFYFGTDQYGRDNLSRVILGTRVSMSVGLIAVFISLIIGISIGLFSGYYGGLIDNICQWFINVVWTIPTLLLTLAISFTLGKGLWQIFIAIGLTMWVEVARVIRGQVISLKEKEFIHAAIALGYSDIRIMFVHLLPNIIKPLSTISASNFASAILIESGLSFLGLGTQPPTPSWGNILKELYHTIILGNYIAVLVPGMMISLIVISLMTLANRF